MADTETAERPRSLDEALLMLQADPPVLTKSKAGQVGNQKTKYADLPQVNAQVLSRLNALGVIWKCKPMMVTYEASPPQFVLRYKLTHVPSGDYDEGDYPLKLSENPQQMGSAITYSRRYALLAITGIAAEDEDDDGNAASGQRYAQRQARPAATSTGGGERATAQRKQRQTGPRPPLPGEADRTEPGSMNDGQRRKLFALLREQSMEDRDEALAFISVTLDREVQSSKELSMVDATTVIDELLSRQAPAEAVEA